MKKTIQKTLSGENQSNVAASSVALKEIIWLAIEYFISTANLQRMLFLLSFLTYSVGDGITAAYMMEKVGVSHELNPVARFVYASHGVHGVIAIKVWFAFVILFFVWLISRKKDNYWAINGFLSALSVGGAMAMGANIMAANGIFPPSPGSIAMTFLFLTVLFVVIGDAMDKIHGVRYRTVSASPS